MRVHAIHRHVRSVHIPGGQRLDDPPLDWQHQDLRFLGS
jgi:hypothetical protein